MASPAGGAPADTAEVALVELPDVAGALKRDWPFLANRTAIAVLLPVLVTWLARSLDFYGPVRALALPLEFLDAGPFAYEAKVIATVTLVLVLSSFLAGRRTTQLVLAIATGALLWVGFVHSRLRWSRFFDESFGGFRDAAPSAAAWAWGVLVLLAALAFALVEGALETRRDQDRRRLAADEARALEGLALRMTALGLLGGLAVAAALVGLLVLLRPAAESGGLFPRVSPVLLLFALGLVLVGAVALAARRRSVGAAPPPPRP